MEKDKLFSWEPNPYLTEFVKTFGKPYFEDDDHYDKQPLYADIKSGKNDPLYSAHMYWTKVPPRGIAKLIQHFTQPGDLVLDPFCGSGMTGLACLLTGRNAILIDLSPACTFIARGYTTPIDPKEFRRAVEELKEKVREEMEYLYETRCRKCGGKAQILHTVWSDVFQCPICENKMRFWDVGRKDEEVLKEWDCPYCPNKLTKRRARLVGTEPVEVYYECPTCGRQRADVDEFDLRKLEEIERQEIPYWYPQDEFPKGVNTRQVIIRGIRRVDQFFTKRNLWALASLWKAGEESGLPTLQFLITSMIPYLSKQYKFRTSGGGQPNNNLYIPSSSKELNILEALKRKEKNMEKFLFELKREGKESHILISTQSATDLSQIPDNSIDYCFTDPPYGANINYSELNFVWEAWLRHFTDNREEAVVNPVQKKGVEEYRELMERAFREIYRVLKPGRYLSLTFHNSRTEIWNAIQSALSTVGFQLVYLATFDKVQRTFNQVTAEGAVGYDVLIHCYKPSLNSGARRRDISKEEIIDFLEEKLRNLPPTKNEGREGRRLHSDFIGWCLGQGISFEKIRKLGLRDYNDFRQLLDEVFSQIDGYYFLPGTLPLQEQGKVFATIKDEASAIHWLRTFLKEPKSLTEIQPAFLSALGGIKISRRLEDILDEYFIEEEGKWRNPTPEEEEDWKKVRRLKQFKKFERWWRKWREEGGDLPPEEIISAGLQGWYGQGKFQEMLRLRDLLKQRGLWGEVEYRARLFLDMAESRLKGEL